MTAMTATDLHRVVHLAESAGQQSDITVVLMDSDGRQYDVTTAYIDKTTLTLSLWFNREKVSEDA